MVPFGRVAREDEDETHCWGVSLVVLASGAVARGQDLDEMRAAPQTAAVAAESGSFLPNTLSARVGSTQAFAFGSGGYNLARHGALADSAVEVTVWGPFALRAQATYSNDTSKMRPSLGARAQLLRQATHGVDGSLTLFFKTEGFSETEGELETFLAVGHRFDRLSLLGNFVYGQDPEGNERDGEIRGAAFWSAGRWLLGVDSRARFAIGTQHGRAPTAEPRFDFEGGPTATIVAGPIAAFAEAGPSAFQLEGGSVKYGVATLAGLGTAF